MLRRLIAFFVALSLAIPAPAGIIFINPFVGFASGPPPTVVYGAPVDDGETMDPTSAPTYDSGTSYSYGKVVADGSGGYYVSIADSNQGNALTSVTKWTRFSEFIYVDATTGNDGTCVVSTTPATAKASPCATIHQVTRRTGNGNGGTALKPNALVLFERGGEYIGSFQFNQIRVSQSITSLSGDGATVTATTPAAHNLINGTEITITGATPAGYNATSVRVTITSPTTFTYANSTTGASSGTIVYSNFYSNFWVGNFGSGALPVLKYNNNNTIASQSYMVWANRAGLRIRGLDFTGEDMVDLLYTAGSGAFAESDVITGSTSGATGTILRIGATGRLTVNNITGSFSNGETITSGAKTGSIGASNSVNPVGGVKHGQREAHMTRLRVHGWRGNGVLFGDAQAGMGSATNVILADSFIYNNMNNSPGNGAGIDQGYGDNILITRNSIYDNGQPGNTQNHNLYLQDFTNVTVSYNDIYMTANYGNHCLVVHGTVNGLFVHHNDMHGCNNGPGINDGYGPPAANANESFTNVQIYQNKIRDMGTRSGQSQGQSFELTGMINSSVYNNLIYNNTGAFSVSDKRASGGTDLPTANLSIRHNTFYETGNLYIQGATTTGLSIQNNVFYSSSASNQVLQKLTALPDAEVTLSFNCVYTPNKAASVTWDSSTYTWGAAGTLLSTKSKGQSTPITNPAFTNAGSGDFTIGGGSPCKNTGTDLDIATDFGGNSRHATTPSIGAYE